MRPFVGVTPRRRPVGGEADGAPHDSGGEQQARVEKLKKLDTAQIAPMAAFLASDAAAEVTSQIFAVRGNEIFLMSQPRPVRGMHTAEGWTPETIAERVLPAMKPNFFPLESSAVVFSWDPV